MNLFCELNNAKSFTQIIDSITDIVTDVNILCDTNNIHIQALDPSRVSLCIFNIDKQSMSYYDNISRCIGINMKLLSKLLHCFADNDYIQLSIDENHDKLTLENITNDKQQRQLKFQIPLMTIDSDYLEIPITDYDITINITTKLFNKLVKDVLVLDSQNICFEFKENNIKLTSITPEGAELSFEQPSNEDLTIKHKLDTKLEFSSRYIKQFLKPCSFTKYVKLYATKDLPIKFEYNIGYDKIIYMCAPKESD